MKCSPLWLLLLAISASGFRHGDPIPMARRTQYAGERTEWADVMGKYSPHFLIFRSIELPALRAEDYLPSREFKMSFAFAQETLQTPWITIANGRGKFLLGLEFTFTVVGNDVVRVQYKTDYNEELHRGEMPTHITVTYGFVEQIERDPQRAISALLSGGVILTLLLVLLVGMKSPTEPIGTLPIRENVDTKHE